MQRVAAMLVLVGLLASPMRAEARQQSTVAYPFEQVWAATVRMIRVDYGFPIHDRDESIGYVLFDYQDHGQSYQGSVELVRTDAANRSEVRVIIRIPSLPGYVERMLLDRLERKLREDYGVPAPTPGQARPERPPSGDAPPGTAPGPEPGQPSA